MGNSDRSSLRVLVPKGLAKRIKTKREALDLSADELGRAAKRGGKHGSHASVYRIERGENVTYDLLVAVCRFLEIPTPPDSFLRRWLGIGISLYTSKPRKEVADIMLGLEGLVRGDDLLQALEIDRVEDERSWRAAETPDPDRTKP